MTSHGLVAGTAFGNFEGLCILDAGRRDAMILMTTWDGVSAALLVSANARY